MNDALRQKLAVYGIWTYRSAWALEIVAAAIGLTTGLVLGLQAFTANESAAATDLVLASAPFLMVALAELTKIPIATLLFSAKWIWKPILAALLLLLAGITFGTVFLGLERATSLRELEYQELDKEKKRLDTELSSLESALLATDQDNAIEKAQQRIEKVNSLAEEERKSISRQIGEVDRELEGQFVLTPFAARLRDQLTDNEARRASRISEQTAEMKAAYDRFQSQRDSFTVRLQNPGATLEQRKRWTEALDRLVNPVPALQAKYQIENQATDSEIRDLRSKFEAAKADMNDDSVSQHATMEKRKAELLEALDQSNKKWAIEKDKARQTLSDLQSKESERAQKLGELRQRKGALEVNIAETENKRVKMARTDQVQRIAGRVFGKNPEDIGPDEANLIALIWFGSLAALAALAGPITAIVALGLQRIGLATASERIDTKLSRLFRRLLLSWRWRRTRTKTVSVEVPIDRVVEKVVKEEVPVEKIIKEILYVPLLTDDPEAVARALYGTLPKDVADIVKISLAGKASPSGNPA